MKALLFLAFGLSARAEILAVPHPFCAFDAKQTVLWSPVFQAGWDSLHAAQKLNMDPLNKVTTWLDAFRWKAEDVLPAGAWSVQTGPITPALYQKANQESKQRCAVEPFVFAQPVHPGHGVLTSMVRQIEWKSPFDQAKVSLLSFRSNGSGQKVRFFGSLNASDLPTVKVLHDSESRGSFALEALCKGSDDRVIFYMPERESSFAEACQKIRGWKKRVGLQQEDGSVLKPTLLESECISIPLISLNHSVDFSALLLEPRRQDPSTAPVSIQRAEQHIFLEFVSKGVASTAVDSIVTDPFAVDQQDEPRSFDYDQPFFVFLWREEAEWPYLGLWLGDTSAMSVP